MSCVTTKYMYTYISQRNVENRAYSIGCYISIISVNPSSLLFPIYVHLESPVKGEHTLYVLLGFTYYLENCVFIAISLPKVNLHIIHMWIMHHNYCNYKFTCGNVCIGVITCLNYARHTCFDEQWVTTCVCPSWHAVWVGIWRVWFQSLYLYSNTLNNCLHQMIVYASDIQYGALDINSLHMITYDSIRLSYVWFLQFRY